MVIWANEVEGKGGKPKQMRLAGRLRFLFYVERTEKKQSREEREKKIKLIKK